MNETLHSCLIAGEQAGSRLVLAPPRGSPVGAGGSHLSNLAGSSIEFRDHREYQPGDDIRRIDWNAYGRSDRLIVKLFREEVSPHVDIILDGSRSMALENTAKFEAAVGLAALFASAASNARFSHTAWLASESCRRIEGGSGRPGIWQGIDFDYPGNIADSLVRNRPGWRRQGIRVLISDLLWLGSPLLSLQSLSRDASAVFVIQILADDDINPPAQGNQRLVDSETGQTRELFIDAAARARYSNALERHQQNWRLACQQAGASMAVVTAEALIADWNPTELIAAQILALA